MDIFCYYGGVLGSAKHIRSMQTGYTVIFIFAFMILCSARFYWLCSLFSILLPFYLFLVVSINDTMH
jgi:hypothetical protein